MTDPLHISASTGSITVTLDGQVSPIRPLNIEGINGQLHEALLQFSGNVQRAKLVHDVKILEASLIALAHGSDISAARSNIDQSFSTAEAARRLADAYLTTHGWRRSDLISPRHGDIVADLDTGRVIVGHAELETGEEWFEALDGDQWSPDPAGRWWTTGNLVDDSGQTELDYDTIRANVTVPAVPHLDLLVNRL